MKSALKQSHFLSVDEVKLETTDIFSRVSADDLQHFFEQWIIHLQQHVDRRGECTEGARN